MMIDDKVAQYSKHRHHNVIDTFLINFKRNDISSLLPTKFIGKLQRTAYNKSTSNRQILGGFFI